MANYLLVENRQIVHLGPIPWRHRFIQSELDDLEVSFTVSPNEMGYVKINDNFEIIPITEENGADIDPRWEDPIGPFYTYHDQHATATWQKHDKPLDQVRQMIKQFVAGLRYNKEQAGTKVDIGGTMVTADTSRDGRAIFTQVYGVLPEGGNVDWKFPEGWINITKEQLGLVIAGGYAYIQEQFVWEKTIGDRVDSAANMDDLKSIYNELNPTVMPGVI